MRKAGILVLFCLFVSAFAIAKDLGPDPIPPWWDPLGDGSGIVEFCTGGRTLDCEGTTAYHQGQPVLDYIGDLDWGYAPPNEGVMVGYVYQINATTYEFDPHDGSPSWYFGFTE